MVEMSDTISFIEKLDERRSQLIQRAEDATTEGGVFCPLDELAAALSQLFNE